MATFDIVNRIVPVRGLASANRTATALSNNCDMRGYESLVAAIDVGTFGDTQSGSVYIEAELQESADNVTYTAVADADMLFPTNKISPVTNPYKARTGTATGTFFQSKTTGSSDPTGLYQVGYRGSKRYIKVNVRYTGTHSTGTPVCVFFEKSQDSFQPSVTLFPAT
jgi:hypothetical protein